MKNRLVCLILCAVTGFTAAGLEVDVTPDPAAVGEAVRIEFSDSSAMPELLAYPPLENAQWQRNRSSQSTRIVNLRSSYTRAYILVPEAPGELRIPELSVRVGAKTVKVAPRTVKVVEGAELANANADAGMPLKQAIFGKIRLTEDRAKYYLGEEIPAEFTLYIAPGTEVLGCEYPTPELAKSVFADFSGRNRDNPRFAPPEQRRAELDGKLWIALQFRTRFRMLAAGEFQLKGFLNVQVAAPETANRRRSADPFDDDNFFGGFFGRANRRRINLRVNFEPSSKFSAVALPPAPAGVNSLDLAGNWQVECRLEGASQATQKAGEPLSLDVEAVGTGGTEILSAPKLDIPGFRCYPPEVKRAAGSALLRYTLIPLRAGNATLAVRFGTFNVARGEWQIAGLDRKLTIVPGPAAASPAPVHGNGGALPPAAPPEDAAAVESTEIRQELHYLKPRPGEADALGFPRGAGYRFLLGVLLIGGPLAAAIILLWEKLRRDYRNDPARQRRSAARSRRGAVLHAVRHDSDLPGTVRSQVIPLLADAHNLPPGISAGELADELADSEMAALLDSCDRASYAPGGAQFDGAFRTKLGNAIKRLTLLFAALLAFGGAAAEPVPDFIAANRACDNGKFTEAIRLYKKCLDVSRPDPVILYNLGCAEYMAGDAVSALRDFEQARLLAPGDAEILANLNLVRRKLLLPPAVRTDSPGALLAALRDRLRPDHWLLLGAAVWCVGLILAAGWRPIRYWSLGTMGVLLLIVGAAVLTQQQGPYNPNRLLIAAEPAELRSLPAAGAGRTEASIPRGTPGELLEKRADWLRIGAAGHEGWVRPGDVLLIVPPTTGGE